MDILLADTDALLMLHSLGGLEIARQLLGVDKIRILPALIHQVEKGKWINKNFPNLDKPALLKEVRRLETIDSVGSIDVESKLNQVSGIDSGEILLLTNLVDNQKAKMITGDLRALSALNTNQSCAAICDAIEGRVFWWPQLLQGIARHVSLKQLEEFWSSSAVRHKTLSIVFGSTRPVSQAHFDTALGSILQDARKKAPFLGHIATI